MLSAFSGEILESYLIKYFGRLKGTKKGSDTQEVGRKRFAPALNETTLTRWEEGSWGVTTPQGSYGAFLAGKKIKLSNIFYVKETIQVVPENTYKTHHVNPSSVTLVSSVGTMVMFLSLD